ncbi:MAG: hypothetical protein SPH94_05070 [Fusobacterium necrophorum]|nr:hypothetical protein [Fusobacterium necrophorum]MCI7680663.1 hypothetical protein [Fusobacterium necrophorum]MDY2573859.1 hypothetical protein [Fusobacterium necrophorum]MDY6172551.1 hypothetical protein [Fusobacterium necrophorum]
MTRNKFPYDIDGIPAFREALRELTDKELSGGIAIILNILLPHDEKIFE